jgi:hypothetical protein
VSLEIDFKIYYKKYITFFGRFRSQQVSGTTIIVGSLDIFVGFSLHSELAVQARAQ